MQGAHAVYSNGRLPETVGMDRLRTAWHAMADYHTAVYAVTKSNKVLKKHQAGM